MTHLLRKPFFFWISILTLTAGCFFCWKELLQWIPSEKILKANTMMFSYSCFLVLITVGLIGYFAQRSNSKAKR